MNEKLLQYLWNFKIFNSFDFKDVDGNDVEILDYGRWNFDSGPDFLFGKIKTNGLIIAGNIELHVKSSDWIFHKHSGNPEFENIIAHVVFSHDVELEEFKNKNVLTLELKDYIDENVISKYATLLQETQFIPCEKLKPVLNSLALSNWKQRLVAERLIKRYSKKSANKNQRTLQMQGAF